jgi:hypothetical protein
MLTSEKDRGSSRSSRTSDKRDDKCDDRRDNRRDDRRNDRDIVNGMSSLSVTKTFAPPSSRVAAGSHDTRRSNDDCCRKSSSARSDHQDTYNTSRVGDSHSSVGHKSSRDPCSSSSNRGYTSLDRGYATSASSGHRNVPRGPTVTASGGGSERVTRSRTKEDTQKVSAGRIEKSRTRKGKGAKVKMAKSKSPSPPQGANNGPLSVEIYAPVPEEGNVPHWSLFVQNGSDGRGISRDVVGNPLGFRFRAADNVRPDHSGRHTLSIPVGDIDDVDYFDQIARATPIQNDVQGWTCQDWVLEALQNLNLNDILGDYEHDEARERLLRRYYHGASSSPSDE